MKKKDPAEASIEAVLSAPALRARRVAGVWLFGSHARGEARSTSDVDIAVLCEPPLDLERAAVMDQVARQTGTEVDLVDLATASPTLAWEVVTSGRLVRDNDGEQIMDFLRRVRHAAEDAEQRDRMAVLAQTATTEGTTL